MATKLGLLGAAAFGVYSLIDNHKAVADAMDETALSIGEMLRRIFTEEGRKDLMRDHRQRQLSVVPQARGQEQTLIGLVRLESVAHESSLSERTDMARISSGTPTRS